MTAADQDANPDANKDPALEGQRIDGSVVVLADPEATPPNYPLARYIYDSSPSSCR